MSENERINIDKEAFELCVSKAIEESANEIYGNKLSEGLYIGDVTNTAVKRSWEMLRELADEDKLIEEDGDAYEAALVRDEDGNELYFGKTVEECRKYCKEHDITGTYGEYIAVGMFDPKWRCFEPTKYIDIEPSKKAMCLIRKHARYAADSYSLELMYQTYGEYNMALTLGVFSYEESRDLHDYIIRQHINNGKWRRECEKQCEIGSGSLQPDPSKS